MTNKLEALVLKRLRQNKNDIRYSMRMAGLGNPFAGESDSARLQQRLQKKINLSASEAKAVDGEVRRRARTKMFRNTLVDVQQQHTQDRIAGETLAIPRERQDIPASIREKVWGDSLDFVNVAFLQRGAQIARSVARVADKNGHTCGSGVLIGEGLFLTSHRVIATARQARQLYLEFDYECDLSGNSRKSTRFNFDTSLFITDPETGLDFTVIGVGEVIDGPETLNAFGISALSTASDKHMIGEFINLVQHPKGRFKEVVLHENRLVNRTGDCLHYAADMEPGSPGSPLYNSEWQIIALHHWGGPWVDGGNKSDPERFEINEAIRVSAIIARLKRRLPHLPSAAQNRIANIVDCQAAVLPSPVQSLSINHHPEKRLTKPAETKTDSHGATIVTLPIEVSFTIPSSAIEPDAMTECLREAGISFNTVADQAVENSGRK